MLNARNQWFDKPPCGAFLELRARLLPGIQTNSQSIIVRVMDSCAGCTPGVPHVDLTKAAFQQLYDLDVGLVESIEVRVLSKPPFDKWGRNEVRATEFAHLMADIFADRPLRARLIRLSRRKAELVGECNINSSSEALCVAEAYVGQVTREL